MSTHAAQFHNVYRDSASAIASILDLHFPEGTIIDATFGQGVFYKKSAGRRIIGVDVRPTGQVVADNKALPFSADAFDVGVLDPPYKRGNGIRPRAFLLGARCVPWKWRSKDPFRQVRF